MEQKQPQISQLVLRWNIFTAQFLHQPKIQIWTKSRRRVGVQTARAAHTATRRAFQEITRRPQQAFTTLDLGPRRR